ncbi:MAG: RtcB family protein, partial [Gemmatimonadota bacterium]|nr:RtcB family protein [Gemmatimonadota bacterium]
MKYVEGVPVYGTHDENTLEQLKDVAGRATKAALMADGHLGYIMPVGGVAAYRNKVSVAGVGFDIACGNAAIRTDLPYSAIEGRRLELADEIWNSISFGIGRNNLSDDAPVDHPLFESDAWDAVRGRHERDSLRAKARNQLGTVGSGNHYVDVFRDEHGMVWVGVHFGSRGLGHTTASNFMALAQGEQWGTRVKETEALLDLDSPLGQDYWAMMNLAGEYAYAGREWVVRKVVEILGGRELELVHNHHNFAWKETHTDPETGEEVEMIVVRKGATPAFPGQQGFVGGSMGDDAVILRGSTDPKARAEQEEGMFSTVHGAGRVMSRTEAAGKVKWRTGQIIRPGKVSPEMMQSWIREKDVVLRGGGLDESPHAYRRLPDVLAAQGNTIEVLHTLTPVVVAMAGANEFDPYRD